MNELDRKTLTVIKALMLGCELHVKDVTYILSKERCLYSKCPNEDFTPVQGCSGLRNIQLLVKNLTAEEFFDISAFVVMNDKKKAIK